jgi:hypothetical protein
MKPTAFVLIAASLLLVSSCRFAGGQRVNGNGNRISSTRSLGNFNSVEVKGGIDLVLSPGTENVLRIEADENLMEFIEVNNNGGTVEVRSRDNYNLQSKSGIKVYATAPEFEHITVSGSGDITSNGMVKSKAKLDLEIRGSGDIKLAVDAPEVATSISGSGSARLQGNTRKFSADVKGSGDVFAFDLLSEDANVDIAGSGNAEIFASKQLSVEIKGAGDVAYKGGGNVNQKIMGSGSVRQVQ